MVIQALDVGPREPWRDGRDRLQDEPHASDLTDEEWQPIPPLLLEPPRRGRKVSVDLRDILNAIRYMARSGSGWRMPPINFGPWQTV